MELSQKEKSDLKRLGEFDRNWKKMSLVGKITIGFSLVFIIMGIYLYLTVIPRFSNLSGSTGDDLKVAYSLWCYTFVLLGFCTFITGYLLVSYCRDLHILFQLYEKKGETPPAPAAPAAQDKEAEKNNTTGEKEKSDGA